MNINDQEWTFTFTADGFNQNAAQNNNGFIEVYNICKAQKECETCPLCGHEPYNYDGTIMYCETGKDKVRKEL